MENSAPPWKHRVEIGTEPILTDTVFLLTHISDALAATRGAPATCWSQRPLNKSVLGSALAIGLFTSRAVRQEGRWPLQACGPAGLRQGRGAAAARGQAGSGVAI